MVIATLYIYVATFVKLQSMTAPWIASYLAKTGDGVSHKKRRKAWALHLFFDLVSVFQKSRNWMKFEARKEKFASRTSVRWVNFYRSHNEEIRRFIFFEKSGKLPQILERQEKRREWGAYPLASFFADWQRNERESRKSLFLNDRESVRCIYGYNVHWVILHFFDLEEVELHRRLPPEHRHQHLYLTTLFIYLTYLPF